MASVIWNGKETAFSEGETLRSFLQSRKRHAENLILEWNGRILTEHDPLETLPLKDGDTLNLFSMVGGG